MEVLLPTAFNKCSLCNLKWKFRLPEQQVPEILNESEELSKKLQIALDLILKLLSSCENSLQLWQQL